MSYSNDKRSIAHREQLLNSSYDCTFLIGEGEQKQEFKALKGVLALVSPVFQAMFFGAQAITSGKSDEVIEIPDISPVAFQILLYYAYFLPELVDSEYWNSVQNALDILYVSQKYLVYDLETLAKACLLEEISANTIYASLQAAQAFELKELEKSCLKFFSEKTSDCLRTDKFVDTTLAQIHLLFNQPKMNISSDLELFRALERYAEKHKLTRTTKASQQDDKKTEIEDIIKEIRFLSLSSKEFEQICQTRILTSEEKIAIVAHIINPNSRYPVPSTISLNRSRFRLVQPDDQSNHDVISTW